MTKATAELQAGRIREQLDTLRQQKADFEKARKNLLTRDGNVLPENQEAYDKAGARIGDIEAQIAALVPDLARANREAGIKTRGRGRPSKVDELGEGTLPPDTNAEQRDSQDVIEAIGVYNNPTSDTKRWTAALDFLFDVASGWTKGYSDAARNFAKKALRFGVNPVDLRPEQQKKYDELTKDVQDNDTPWSSYVYQKGGRAGRFDTPYFEQQRIAAVLKGMPNGADVAAWVARTAPNPEYRRIALKVAERMRAMEARGFVFNTRVYDSKEGMPSNAAGFVRTYKNNGINTIDIGIRSPKNESFSGANYTTILHELTHAALVTAMRAQPNAPIRAKLEDILKHTNNIINADGNTNLREMVTNGRLYNAFENVDELVAWTLTDPHARAVLERIPTPGLNIWQRMMRAIRSWLGMSQTSDNVLSDVLNSADQLLLSDPIFDPDVDNLIARQGAGPTPAGPEMVAERRESGVIRDAYDKLGGNKVKGLRAYFTDSMTSAGDKWTRGFGGKVRSAEGEINPEVLMSQAIQSDRFSAGAQQYGYVTFRDKMPIVDDLKVPEGSTQFNEIAGEKVSYVKALLELAELAKRNNTTFEAQQKILDELLVGRREHFLYKAQDEGKGSFEFGLTRDQAAQRNAQFNADPTYRRIGQMLDAVRYAHIDFLVDAGRIDKETAARWKEATGYIQFNRIAAFEKAEQEGADGQPSPTGRGANRGLAAFKNIKKYEGSKEKQVTSPLEQFSGLIDWMVSEGMRNNAVRNGLEVSELLGFAQKVPVKDAAPDPKRVVEAYKEGKKVAYYVEDPLDLMAFSIAPNTVSDVVRGFQKFSQILRAGVTSTPPFVLKQVADDILRIYAYSELKNPSRAMFEVLRSFPKNWFNELAGKKTPAVEEMERRGIRGSFDFTEFGNLTNIMEEAGVKQRTLGRKMLHVMEAGARAQDMTVRQAIYNQILRENPGDYVYAESQAREIINFSRRGAARSMDYMIRLVPFFNAYARGMDKVFTAATGGKVGGAVTGQARAKFWKRVGVLSAMGLTYALLMQDDENYLKLDDHVRDRNWVLPFAKDERGYPYGIPIPEELAFIFKAIPERVVQYYRLQGTPEERDGIRVLGELAKQGVEMYATPNLSPQALRGLLEVMFNHSMFLGRPLESAAQLRENPEDRKNMMTSDTMAAISETLAEQRYLPTISPIRLEHLWRSMLGSIGGITLEISDSLINPTRTDRPLHRSLVPMLTGVSAYMNDPVGGRYLSTAYQLSEQVERVEASYNKRLNNDPESAAKFLERNYGAYSVRPAVKGLMDDIRQLNADARAVDKMSGQLTPEERREAIDLIRMRQQQIARRSLEIRAEMERIQSGM
jgi:hypothetical protein